jgi:hypothetical protein
VAKFCDDGYDLAKIITPRKSIISRLSIKADRVS